MSEFLENLKKAADNGEFNSKAAKKIVEINELADSKLGSGTPEELEKLKENIQERYKDFVIEPVTEEKAMELNSEYERKMEQIKKLDGINAQLATLIEIEDMVKASVEDMFEFVSELEQKFKKEIEVEDPMFGDLFQKIEQIKSKYNPIIN